MAWILYNSATLVLSYCFSIQTVPTVIFFLLVIYYAEDLVNNIIAEAVSFSYVVAHRHSRHDFSRGSQRGRKWYLYLHNNGKMVALSPMCVKHLDYYGTMIIASIKWATFVNGQVNIALGQARSARRLWPLAKSIKRLMVFMLQISPRPQKGADSTDRGLFPCPGLPHCEPDLCKWEFWHV